MISRSVFVFLLLFGHNAGAVSVFSEALLLDQWPHYENGTNVTALGPVNSILSKFEEHEKVTLEIRYPGGDSGRQWAESLMKWMVSYGIPKKFIELLPGAAADRLVIDLIDRR